MVIIKRNRVTVNRGDDVVLPVDVSYIVDCACGHERPYQIDKNDMLHFRLYRGTRGRMVLDITGDSGDSRIVIPAYDTEWLRPGRYYATITLEMHDGREIRIWPAEKPDEWGKVRRESNFTVAEGAINE